MVLQFILNGIVLGSIIVLGATGLSLIYGVRRFANFAHGDMMTLGAYFVWTFAAMANINFALAFILALPLGALVGIASEFLIFRNLRGRGPVIMLVASVGLAFFLQNTVGFIWTGLPRLYPLVLLDNWVLPLGLTLNPLRGFIPIVVGLGIILFLHVLLKYTKIGTAMRATADNPDLARSSGVSTTGIIYFTWAVAGALTAAGGTLLALRTNLEPTTGFSVLLLLFAAVILGGIGSPYGAMAGSMVIGISAEVYFWFVLALSTPFGWSTELIQILTRLVFVVPFSIMVLVLLLRPSGIAGRVEEIEVVRGRVLRYLRDLFGRKGPEVI